MNATLKEKYAHLLPAQWDEGPALETVAEPVPAGLGSYYLATYGCQMNVYDSNLIAEMLEGRGLRETHDPARADIIIVNTCSIRGGAEDKAYARIAAMRHHKKSNPDLKIAVVGCMAQNHGEKIPVSLEHVDVVAGPDNYKSLEEALFREGGLRVLTRQDHLENYPGLMAKPGSSVSAFVTIMRGCNKHCTYCIVPYVRGKERSRDPGEIEDEVRRAVERGIPEVTLLGQTVNSYRVKGCSFAGLLRRLDKVEGLRRLRFTSPHPRHFTEDAIEAMAESPSVCRHVHLPLQSGNNRILKEMRRQYTREKFLDIVASLRRAMPGIAVTTDIIVGYPGESEAEFEDTLSLVQEVGFDGAFTFAYSPREGTPAWEIPESLSEPEKNRRLERLIGLQNGITREKLDEQVGRPHRILLEGPSTRRPEEWVGKTSCFRKVVVPHENSMRPGQFINVVIEERRGITLAGRQVPNTMGG